MSFNTKIMVFDGKKQPISQYYNPLTDSYEPLEGEGGALHARLKGRTAESLIANGLTIAAGATVVVEAFAEHANIDELSVSVASPDATHSFDVIVTGRDMAGYTYTLAQVNATNNRAVVTRFRPDIIDIQVSIKNSDTVGHAYSATKTVWNK